MFAIMEKNVPFTRQVKSATLYCCKTVKTFARGWKKENPLSKCSKRQWSIMQKWETAHNCISRMCPTERRTASQQPTSSSWCVMASTHHRPACPHMEKASGMRSEWQLPLRPVMAAHVPRLLLAAAHAKTIASGTAITFCLYWGHVLAIQCFADSRWARGEKNLYLAIPFWLFSLLQLCYVVFWIMTHFIILEPQGTGRQVWGIFKKKTHFASFHIKVMQWLETNVWVTHLIGLPFQQKRRWRRPWSYVWKHHLFSWHSSFVPAPARSAQGGFFLIYLFFGHGACQVAGCLLTTAFPRNEKGLSHGEPTKLDSLPLTANACSSVHRRCSAVFGAAWLDKFVNLTIMGLRSSIAQAREIIVSWHRNTT